MGNEADGGQEWVSGARKAGRSVAVGNPIMLMSYIISCMPCGRAVTKLRVRDGLAVPKATALTAKAGNTIHSSHQKVVEALGTAQGSAGAVLLALARGTPVGAEC
jgi:hypothetical protein